LGLYFLSGIFWFFNPSNLISWFSKQENKVPQWIYDPNLNGLHMSYVFEKDMVAIDSLANWSLSRAGTPAVNSTVVTMKAETVITWYGRINRTQSFYSVILSKRGKILRLRRE
jgi:hypothetical protein